MSFSGKIILLSLAQFLAAALVHAQQPPSVQEPSDREDSLSAAVFVGDRGMDGLSRIQTARVEVISAAGLQKMACCNLAESFENSASVTVGYSDAVTGARQIRLLGLSGVYTQMLDENRPVMRGINSPFGLGFIPGQWLESIQIAKGSPSVINGAESMTGQINMEHRKPTDEKPLLLSFTGMSDSRLNLDAVSSFQLNDKLYASVLAHADGNFKSFDMNEDGFMDDPRSMQFNLSSRWLYYTPSVQLRFGVRAMQDHRLGGEEGYDRKSYIPGDFWGTDITNRSTGAYVKAGIPLREDQSSSIAAIFDYNCSYLSAWFGPKSYQAAQNSAFLNLIYRNQINATHDFTFGASTNIDRLDEYGISVFSNGGVYGEYTFHAGEWLTAIAGARAEAYKGDGIKFVPRATLRIQPVKALVLRMNGGRGLRYSRPFTDNFGVFSTGKKLMGSIESILEDSWTYGGNATLYLPLGADKENCYVSFDFFRTDFSRQLYADYENDRSSILFRRLGRGESWSDNYQFDFTIEPVSRLTVNLTARYTDSRIVNSAGALVERPMTGSFKAVLNLQYKTNLSRWIFDFTASLNGSARVYNFMEDDYKNSRTPVYPMLYAQITRRFKGLDVYVGAENLTNYTQKNPVIGPRRPDGRIDATSALFDASAIWGPLMGLRLDAGIRLTIWKTY